MGIPNENTVQKVRQWLTYADEDLRLASCAMKLRSNVPYRLIAYHAQQCAEKHLKAYLVSQGVDFPYTHNISTLIELCYEHEDWPTSLRDAEELTRYAITTRYPGEDAMVTEAEVRRSIELAKQVRTVVRAALKERGIELG